MAFRDIASAGARAYVGSVSRDKGTTGGVSSDQQVQRFYGRSENQPALNPYDGRPVVDQTLGDQFGEAKYELKIGLQIQNLIRADAEQPWFTMILPLRQSDELTFTATIWTYNRRLPTPTPYHAPSPYVTEHTEQFRGQLQRYGESIRMESDFFHTPEGQQNFFLKLTGIASDMVEGLRFDVMRELLRSIDEHKRYYANHTYIENPVADIMMRVQLFATLNKAPTKTNQLAIITEKLERVLNEAVPGPYELIFPPEWGIWVNKVSQTPVPQPYYLQGDDGGQLFIRNGPTPKGIIGRNNFWEYQDVNVETGSLPLRMLQRPVSIAENYRSTFNDSPTDLFSMMTGLLASEKNIGRMRNIFVYSLSENKYIEVHIKDMLKASGIVPKSYNKNEEGSRDYRDLVQEYRDLKTSARSKFYPDEKEHDSGQMNFLEQREAPMFLAWEPKGSVKGNQFIRVKYSGETDSNVTGYEDHNNQGQILCATLAKTFSLDRIGAHYANAFLLRRTLQQAPDNQSYWEAFYEENIFYSLTSVDNGGAGVAYTAEFTGSKLSAADDYAQYRERWGKQEFDTIGELATQPAGHYILPTRTGANDLARITVPPGCDCPVGIRTISEATLGTGWNEISKAVKEHENALLAMVEMAKKLPESELVNPLNRDPWVHSSDIGAFSTAYTNGVSQFRAPLFLWGYANMETTDATGTAATLTITPDGEFTTGNTSLYGRDPGLRGLGIAGVRGRGRSDAPSRAVDPVTGSLGVDDEDEDIDDGLEPEDTLLQELLREYFVELQGSNANIDTSYERAPTANARRHPGLMYVVTYFTNETAGVFANSYIRAVFIDYDTLNTTDENVASDISEAVKLIIGAPSGGALGSVFIAYITTDANQAATGGLLVPDESIGTVATRLNQPFTREAQLYYGFGPVDVVRTNRLRDGTAFYALTELQEIEQNLREHLKDVTAFPTGPLGRLPVVAGTVAASTGLGDSPTLRPDAGGPGTFDFAIRCALVMTPGMIKKGTYKRLNSMISPGNKETGYTTPIKGGPHPLDGAGAGRLERSPLVHGLTSIMEKVGAKGYLEWENSTPRHQSHFGFNQVHARAAGMDDDGMFPDAEYAGSGYYEEEEDSFVRPDAISSRAPRGRNLLGSRDIGSSSGQRGGLASYYDGLNSAEPIGAREEHSYFDGARSRGRGRFGRRPFAHNLTRPHQDRFSDANPRDFVADVRLSGGKLRKGYRMVRRLNGSNFVQKIGEVTTDPTSPCTFFTIAAMMSRCDKLEHWMKLSKNRLHIAADFLLHRIVEVYAESALLLKAGLGFTLVGHADFKNGEVVATKTYHAHLTVHFGAFVDRPDHQLILEDMRLVGYIGGKGSGMVMSPDQLETGSSQRGSRRPSFIVAALPIAQKKLSPILSPSGTLSGMDDVLPENMPVQGALFGGVDWHARRWRFEDKHNEERNAGDFFNSKGNVFPAVSFQGWQANYDLNDGSFKVYSQGEGHLAGGDYPGAIHVVNGDVPYFDYPGDPSFF